MSKFRRRIVYYRSYYLDFLESLDAKVQFKFEWTLNLIRDLERVPVQYFKFITGTVGIYEVRVEVGGDIYRVFAFFDEGSLVILVNGFKKTSMKTPRAEIRMAEKLKRQYFDEKDRK